MVTFENQNIEFQQEYVPDIRKEVMGFANADGGTVYVGIRKDGVVLGVSDPDGVMLQIVNSLKDSLAPDIMPFVRVTTIELEEKPVIENDVTLQLNGMLIRKGDAKMCERGLELIERTMKDCGWSEDNPLFAAVVSGLKDKFKDNKDE